MSAAARRSFAWNFGLLALVNLMWSSQGTAVKFLDKHIGPISITFLPFYVTTLLLIPVLIRSRRRNPRAVPLTGKDLMGFALAGVGGQVVAQLGMTWGISKSLASNGAVLNLLIPVFTAVLASIMLHEKMTRLRWTSLSIGLVGVLLLSTGDLRESSLGHLEHLTGNLLILAGCLGSSFYNVYCKGLMQRFSEVDILIFSYIAASFATIPLFIWVEPVRIQSFHGFNWPAWAAFAFLAIFMYGVSMLLFFHVLQRLDVTIASMSLYLVPVFGVLLATVLVGERLGPTAIVGAVVVLASCILLMRYDTA
ncbi:MAG: DMT family transporter [Bryobacterales bacterium]|nr:DMT family transporter [Bryobacterales bacterium]